MVPLHNGKMCVVFLLLYGLVVAVEGQDGGLNSTACCGQTDDGLESADIAAIILGVILFLLLLIAIFVCILAKKGYICKEPDDSKVGPTGLGFSTTAEKLRGQTNAAFEMEKETMKRSSNGENQPIIYMFDDIYHPPNSRPLPHIPNGYPVATRESRTPRKPSTHRKPSTPRIPSTQRKPSTPRTERKLQETPSIPTSMPKRPRSHGDGTSLNSSRTVSVNGHLIFPDNARINFTTNYESSEPYRV